MRLLFQSMASKIFVLIFSADAKRSIRITRWLMTTATYGICLGLSAHLASLGIAEKNDVAGLWIYILCGMSFFYFLLRSGISTRFADPSLAFAQCLFAVGAILYSYFTVGEIRGAVLILLPLVMVFGMLSLSPAQTTLLSLIAVFALGSLMVVMSHFFPQKFPAHMERIYFLLLAPVLLSMSWIARQIANLRERLRQQRTELSAALQKVNDLAIRDDLTGLFNRRYMHEVLGNLHKQSLRTTRSFCVALIDLDHFKQVNDQFGHQTGDEVLCGFAKHALIALRETDILGRWGGEEFLLIFPETDEQQANAVMARLHLNLGQSPMSVTIPELRICFSAGLILHDVAVDTQNMLEYADVALYKAKQEGRNCTVIWKIKIAQQ